MPMSGMTDRELQMEGSMSGAPHHGLGRWLGLSRSELSRRFPRLRTAMRAARVGDRRSAPSRRDAAAGSPFPRRARRSSLLAGVTA